MARKYEFLMVRFLCFVSLACALGVFSGCEDDEFYIEPAWGGNVADLALEMSYHPDMGTELVSTRSASGDAIRTIHNVFVVFFNVSGDSVLTHYAVSDTLDVTYKPHPDGEPVPTGEPETQCVIMRCRVPVGTYRVYAVANMGNLAEDESYKASVAKLNDFKAIRFNWVKDAGKVASNNQMSGWFTENGSYPTDENGYKRYADLVSVRERSDTLHAWLRRAVSKITINYDATELNRQTYIYIKSVTVKDIPTSCSLVDVNTPHEPSGVDGDTICYGTGNDYLAWPALTRFEPKLENDSLIHLDSSPSLFFYENMQGNEKSNPDIKDKRQDSNGDGLLDAPGKNNQYEDEYYKDKETAGTYIEVEGYYVSNEQFNVGKGPIKYRFMLGKDAIKDYNAERNCHYKITLKFKGRANEVDWHVDYEEVEVPGRYMPDYYVSYLYNQPEVDMFNTTDSYWEKCYPIRMAGNNLPKKIKVQIIENNWGPLDPDESLDYYTGKVETFNTEKKSNNLPKLSGNVTHTGVWHGFLSLYRAPEEYKGTMIGTDWQRFSAGEYFYWYGSRDRCPVDRFSYTVDKDGKMEVTGTPAPLLEKDEIEYGMGVREYDLTMALGETEKIHYDYDLGSYKVVKSVKNGIQQITLYIPLFTRQLQFNTKKGFTGGNPYFSFLRLARLRVTGYDGNGNSDTPTECNVRQVRRIINPKGVFRSWDNTSPFNVTLMHRESEASGALFTSFKSEGEWRATIVKGNGWHITGKAEGSAGSIVSFTVAPDNVLEDETKTACAIVLVEYHDYKCIHYIFLRQGYAPIQLLDGGAYWHTFNMTYMSGDEVHESDHPLDGGSMFRYGNLTQPIDAVNNTFTVINTREPMSFEIDGEVKPAFLLAPLNYDSFKDTKKAAWSEIKPGKVFPSQDNWKSDGVSVRMPTHKDFNNLHGTDATVNGIEVGWGICYGDNAYTCATVPTNAFHYSRYHYKGLPEWLYQDGKPIPGAPVLANEDVGGAFGMRGVFIYNTSTAAVFFLPLGEASQGRRKGLGEGTEKLYGDGTLHYGDFDRTFLESYSNQAAFVPLLHDLYKNYGAIYWINKHTIDENYLDCSSDNSIVAWDFNYSGMNVTPIFSKNMHTNATDTDNANDKSDACFIRLVQDEAPTEEQCKAIDLRVKQYRKAR